MKLRVERLENGSWDFVIHDAAGVKVASTQLGYLPSMCGLFSGRHHVNDLFDAVCPLRLRVEEQQLQCDKAWELITRADSTRTPLPAARDT